MPKFFVDIAGQRFGKLVALSRAPTHGHCKSARWVCRCDCGVVKEFGSRELRREGPNATRSCGCRKNRKGADHPSFRHGKSHGPEYRSWCAMLRRCQDPSAPEFFRHAGRGIVVCERWKLFDNFFTDMGARPKGRTLDRIDNDGDYGPGNCRWATPKQQANNRRLWNGRPLTANGVTLSAREWSERSGIRLNTISERLRSGWSTERAVTEPPKTAAP